MTVANLAGAGGRHVPRRSSAARAAAGPPRFTPTSRRRTRRRSSASSCRARATGRGRPADASTGVNPDGADSIASSSCSTSRAPPRAPADGSVVYRGLGTAATLSCVPGRGIPRALRLDHGGNVSHGGEEGRVARRARPLRPLTGSVVLEAPAPELEGEAPARRTTTCRSSTRASASSSTGRRAPPTASLSAKLEPGTYVWYVWPAVRHKGASPTFGALIGRATFVVRPSYAPVRAPADRSRGTSRPRSGPAAPLGRSATSSSAQRSRARGQRGWKRQPPGRREASGTSPLEDGGAAGRPRARARRDGDERLRVRVLRALDHVGGVAQLDHAPEVHDARRGRRATRRGRCRA